MEYNIQEEKRDKEWDRWMIVIQKCGVKHYRDENGVMMTDISGFNKEQYKQHGREYYQDIKSKPGYRDID